MAYKVFVGVDTLGEVSDMYALANPMKNPFICDENSTYDEYYKYARQLFSTENIRNNPLIFCDPRTSSAVSYPEYSIKFLQNVLAELHEYAFYISIMYDSYGQRYYDNRCSINYGNASQPLSVNPGDGQTVELDGAAYWAGLNLYLLSIKDFFASSLWAQLKNRRTVPQLWAPCNAFRWPAFCMQGYRFIRRTISMNREHVSNAPSVSAYDIKTMWEGASPNAAISFVYDANWGFVCVAPISAANKSSLYQVFSASQDVTAILGKGQASDKTKGKFKANAETSKYRPRVYGVELELCTAKTPKEMIDLQGDPVGFLLKSDASITGNKNHKYECVTLPLELSEQRKLWTRFFANVGSKNDFDVSTLTNNGMHVHIGRDRFDDEHLRRFCWFVTAPENREFIIALSQRAIDSFDRWSPAPNYGQYRKHLDAFNSSVTMCAGLRGAVNIGHNRNKPTVEVRIFKGIVSCAEVLRNLEAVDALYEFTLVSKYRQLTLWDFWIWLKEQPRNKYKLLRADIYKLDMDTLVKKSKTLRICFGLQEPEKIVDVINQQVKKTKGDKTHEFIIDKIVFATITRLIGRRAFGLDSNGTLSVVQKNVGRISHLDEKITKEFAKRK
jgi:hypothetical protein